MTEASACEGTVRLRPMRLEDLPAVEAIEGLSFGNPWPLSAYAQELGGNRHAHYLVACLDPPAGAGNGQPPAPRVVGYAGLWMQVDEAHVSTLAVDPGCRRRGIGERLLVGLVDLALAARAVDLTLEVRASNLAARRLYEKYGFEVVGERRRYYSDNGEDAVIMTTPELYDPAWRARFQTLRARWFPRSGS